MLKEFLQNPSSIGAVTPYSKYSVSTLLNKINRNDDLRIVEFGPGTGNFTKEILSKMSGNSSLTCFELNKQFFSHHLDTIHDQRLTIHYEPCQNIRHIMKGNSVDIIISTIPLSLLPNEDLYSIIYSSYESLKSGGIFITGQYNTKAKKSLDTIFHNTHTSRAIYNFPPVCIIESKKL